MTKSTIAQIENLQARYLFALDFHDPQLYASTFTPDGILDYGEGDVKGREAIIKVIAGMPATGRRRLRVVPRRERQPRTPQHHRRLRPLRGQPGQGERPVVLHEAEDLQRRQREVAIQGRSESGLVTAVRSE